MVIKISTIQHYSTFKIIDKHAKNIDVRGVFMPVVSNFTCWHICIYSNCLHFLSSLDTRQGAASICNHESLI